MSEVNTLFEIDRELDSLLDQIEEEAEECGAVSPELLERFQQFCQAESDKLDAKADVASSGGQLSGKSSALRSGRVCVFWINFDCRARQVPLGYDQSHASLRYLIARTRTANAGIHI